MVTAEVLLCGSLAGGVHGPASDHDILVLTNGPESREARRGMARRLPDLEQPDDVILSTIHYTKTEWRRRTALPSGNEVKAHGTAL